MRPALHLGHHGPAQGLHPEQRLLPARRPVVCRAGRPVPHPPRCRACHHTAAAAPYERAGLLPQGGAGRGRLPGAARPLPSANLAGQRARQRRDHRALPRRDAGHAPVGAAVGCRSGTCAALGLWRRRGAGGGPMGGSRGEMRAMLLSAPPSAADREHALRWGFGAGVERKNHGPFEERFGLPLIEAWAMTETGAAACIIANREPRLVGTNCFGRQEDFVETRLVAEDGSDAGVDAPGELLVRSAGNDPRRHFFCGYLKDDEATRAAWADGWFHTGDLVRRDAAGNFFFIDRKKNVIRRSGENISAVEVESVLNHHPAVQASAVAATPDPVRGDEVLACIVVRAHADAGQRAQIAASIVEHALAQLAYHKAPGYVAFVDALPLTPSQKIQRGQLRELAQALPGQRHCIDTRALKKRPAAPA